MRISGGSPTDGCAVRSDIFVMEAPTNYSIRSSDTTAVGADGHAAALRIPIRRKIVQAHRKTGLAQMKARIAYLLLRLIHPAPTSCAFCVNVHLSEGTVRSREIRTTENRPALSLRSSGISSADFAEKFAVGTERISEAFNRAASEFKSRLVDYKERSMWL